MMMVMVIVMVMMVMMMLMVMVMMVMMLLTVMTKMRLTVSLMATNVHTRGNKEYQPAAARGRIKTYISDYDSDDTDNYDDRASG